MAIEYLHWNEFKNMFPMPIPKISDVKEETHRSKLFIIHY
jgi:hypothetical protein